MPSSHFLFPASPTLGLRVSLDPIPAVRRQRLGHTQNQFAAGPPRKINNCTYGLLRVPKLPQVSVFGLKRKRRRLLCQSWTSNYFSSASNTNSYKYFASHPKIEFWRIALTSWNYIFYLIYMSVCAFQDLIKQKKVASTFYRVLYSKTCSCPHQNTNQSGIVDSKTFILYWLEKYMEQNKGGGEKKLCSQNDPQTPMINIPKSDFISSIGYISQSQELMCSK